MKNRALKAIAVFFTLTVLRPVAAAAGEYPVNQPKRVLVELFTSQGCSSCAPASELLGKLTEPGVDRDRIVPLNLHVDYFNQPWPDPYSNASYTRRQCDYKGRRRTRCTPPRLHSSVNQFLTCQSRRFSVSELCRCLDG